MLNSRFKSLTTEQKTKRKERLERAYKSRVDKIMADDESKDKIGIGSGDASLNGTVFFRITKKIGGLAFIQKPDEASKVFQHYQACSQLLNKEVKAGNIHPLIGPIPLTGVDERPVLLRRIGLTLDKYCDKEKAELIGGIMNEYLGPLLLIAGLRRSSGFNFDLRKPANIAGNKKMISIINKTITEELENIKNSEGKNKQEIVIELFQKWYELGGRLYLFDYGTWLKPEEKSTGKHTHSDKYGKLYHVDKNGTSFAIE